MINDDVMKRFSGANCLVTGGTGLIGRAVVRMLCNAGAKVRVASLDRINVDERADHVLCDLTEFAACRDLVKGMDDVFHLAGIKGSIHVTTTQPASSFVPLLMMNTNLLEAARREQVRGLVYTSSIGAYPDAEVFREDMDGNAPPMDRHPGWAKRVAEMQIEAYKIQYGLDRFSVVRPCNVYGPGDNFDPDNAMVVPTLMHRILRGDDPVLIWGDGSAIRDFAYSRDVAAGIILAIVRGTGAFPFLNLAGGQGHRIRELVETLQSFIDFTPFFDVSKPSGFPRRVMDITNARDVLGYVPEYSLRQGLEETWNWYRANQTEYLDRQNYFSDDGAPQSGT
ncbi:MAG: NAD-dependent epimerase/dehydratase family protein [Rhodospirillales bacterium]|nr:NAD-dependent epimerase/dehydratase family protein [Rhodospirillales bacterium]